jgi:hypothetical protein
MIARRDFITELKPAPTRWFCMLLGSFAFIGGGMFVLGLGTVINLVMGVSGIVFGIVGVPVSLSALFSKRIVLRLTPEGFSFGTLRKKYFYNWTDIAQFGVGSVGVKKTCFTLRADYQGETKVRAINQGFMGFDRFLPDTYGKKPVELAKLLEEWRQRYAGSN